MRNFYPAVYNEIEDYSLPAYEVNGSYSSKTTRLDLLENIGSGLSGRNSNQRTCSGVYLRLSFVKSKLFELY